MLDFRRTDPPEGADPDQKIYQVCYQIWDNWSDTFMTPSVKNRLPLEKTFKDQFSLRSGINDGNLCFGGGLKIFLFGKMSFIDYSFENVEFDESPNQILTLTLSL